MYLVYDANRCFAVIYDQTLPMLPGQPPSLSLNTKASSFVRDRRGREYQNRFAFFLFPVYVSTIYVSKAIRGPSGDDFNGDKDGAMIELYENLSKKEAELCSLVLDASFISHRVRRRGRGLSILVDEHNYEAARETMAAYFVENRIEHPFPAPAEEDADHAYAGIWMAAFLGAIHVYVSNTGYVRDIWDQFGASAARINDGEWFRTVTALMLHADAVHLAGNMAGMAIFGTAVAQVAGWGVGFLLILLAGAAGNFLNAMMMHAGHLSIGASTAVFAAVGILSAHQFVRRRKTARRSARAWIPVFGGIALLGILGTGERVDLGAHLLGFAAGIGTGVLYGILGPGRTDERIQWVCACAASGIIVFAWVAGYLYG